MIFCNTQYFLSTFVSFFLHRVCCRTCLASTQRRNTVVRTSMRRDDIASTSKRRHFDVICALGVTFHNVIAFFPVLVLLLLVWLGLGSCLDIFSNMYVFLDCLI